MSIDEYLKEIGVVYNKQHNKYIIKLTNREQVLILKDVITKLKEIMEDENVIIDVAKSGDYVIRVVVTKSNTRYLLTRSATKEQLEVIDTDAIVKALTAIRLIRQV